MGPLGPGAPYVIYPIQTLACAAVLAYFWRTYRLRMPRKAWLGLAIGVAAFLIWISPQALFHQPPRVGGFNVDEFSDPWIYWGELVMRFLRLVVVVPVLEEVFWRGFLLRYLIDPEFERVPFGTYARMANAVVALGFMLEHSTPDWPAALATGLLYNIAAYRSRSLSTCILAHAVTNALLGAYIMTTRQWGFW